MLYGITLLVLYTCGHRWEGFTGRIVDFFVHFIIHLRQDHVTRWQQTTYDDPG